MINEVSFLRFTAIFLMMVVHVPDLGAYTTAGFHSISATIVTAGQQGFGRIAAPLVGLMSGYFCVAMIEKRGPGGFVGRKVKTLLVPLAFWNILDFLVLILLYFVTRGAYYQVVWDTSPGELVGLFKQPVNYPLHYLADLFKCCLVFAAVHVTARWIGLPRMAYAWLLAGLGSALCAGIVFVTAYHGGSVLAIHGYGTRLLFRPDLALFFFFGTALAASGVPLTELFEIARRRVGVLGVAALFCATVLIAMAGVGVAQRYGAESVRGVAFDLGKRFVGATFLISLVAHLSARGLIVPLSNRLSFRMFCSHFVFFQVFLAFGIRPVNGPETVIYLVAFPVAATLLAWASLELQDRIGRGLAPGPLRRMVEAIP